jgi:hypothetical protein
MTSVTSLLDRLGTEVLLGLRDGALMDVMAGITAAL